MPKSERARRPDDATPTRVAQPSELAVPPRAAERPITTRLNSLQGAAGNRAVQRLVQASRTRQQPAQRSGDEEAYSQYTPYTSIPAAESGIPGASPATPIAGASGAASMSGYESGESGYQNAGALTPQAGAMPPTPATPAPRAPVVPSGGIVGASPSTPIAGSSGSASMSDQSGYQNYLSLGSDAPLADGSATPAAGSPSAAAMGGGAGAGIGGLAPLTLPAKYAGEDREAGWRAFFDEQPGETPEQTARRTANSKSKKVVTKYNTPEEIEQNTLKPQAGAGGTSLTTPAGAPATYKGIYAMGQAGQVVGNLDRPAYEVVEGQRRNMHHSSLLAGADVTHAGHIGVESGAVNYLDDDSGHYRPDEAHTKAAFDELARQGVLNPNSATGRVNLVDKTKEKGKGQERGETASVHFSGYQQAGGNEKGIRAKGSLMKELLAKTPRYEGDAFGPEREPTPAPAVAGGVGTAAAGPVPGGAMQLAPEAPPVPADAVDARLYDPAYVASAAGADIIPGGGGPSVGGGAADIDDGTYNQETAYGPIEASPGASAPPSATALTPEEIAQAIEEVRASQAPDAGAGGLPAGYGQYRGLT
ncbi:MAG: hypothetical protein FJ037_02085 [Chloroflexi bacterium]|nr:hypothetical protein [Chloroflexota bacterium]